MTDGRDGRDGARGSEPRAPPLPRRGVERGTLDRLTGRERDRVWSEYMELIASQDATAWKLPGTRRVAIVLMALALAMPIPIVFLAALKAPFWLQWTVIAATSLGVFLVVILLTTGIVGPRRRYYWAALRRCGHDVCVICGYRLERRAPDSRACPECGTPDDRQPVPLGTRPASSEWPRFEPEPKEASDDADARGSS